MPKKEVSLPLCVMQIGRSFIPAELVRIARTPDGATTLILTPKQKKQEVVIFEKAGKGILCIVALPIGYRLSDHEPPEDVLKVLDYNLGRRKKLK